MSSIDAALREQWPELLPMQLTKRVVLAASRAIEDVVLEHADRPVLIGGFQRAQFWRASETRWRALALRSHTTVVLADLPGPTTDGPLHEVPLGPDAPLRREWIIVCDSPTAPAVLVATEGDPHVDRADLDRVFHAWWSVDPVIVREAARIGIAIATPAHPAVFESVGDRLAGEPRVTADSMRLAMTLTTRIVAEIERLSDEG
jgi:DICT domain-containing protein